MAALAGALCVSLFSVSAPAVAGEAAAAAVAPETASLNPGVDGADLDRRLPRILSDADVERYREIMALQEKGEWKKADRLIANLDDRLLMGHVGAQRYLHPTRYRSRFVELREWLKRYHDHPEAGRLYRLAMKRKPRRARSPRAPTYGILRSAAVARKSERIERTSRQEERARQYVEQAKRFAREGKGELAEQYLSRREVARHLRAAEIDSTRGYIASRYFYLGRDEKAYGLAERATHRGGRQALHANWIAGLSSFRLGKYERAARHFETMVATPRKSPWDAAAGAFWAARSNLVAGKPERVHRYLKIATKYPRTFYGLLGYRLLGEKPQFRFAPPEVISAQLDTLASRMAGRRALALLQIGERYRAERELRALTLEPDPAIVEALVALAEAMNMPALALRVGMTTETAKGERLDGALYPVPRWQPSDGYVVDRALLFAFMRQESAFNVRAKSRVGARGLMQLMPSTASYISNSRFRGRKRDRLYDPDLNISLGQKYLSYLIKHDTVQGDLFRLAAAYNGGPGNLAKWQRRSAGADDALLFIESIPARETRKFIERVLANLWIYRLRLGQQTPSLDAIAAGERPIYQPLDRPATKVVENARH